MFALRLYSRLFARVLILHNILNQTSFQAASLQRGQKSSGFFIDHVNHVLDVPKTQSKQVTNMAHCLQECVRNHRCFSTNIAVDRDKNGRLTCELLPTDKYNASISFRRRQFFHHFSLVVRNRLWYNLQMNSEVILYWNSNLELLRTSDWITFRDSLWKCIWTEVYNAISINFWFELFRTKPRDLDFWVEHCNERQKSLAQNLPISGMTFNFSFKSRKVWLFSHNRDEQLGF